MKNVYFIFLQHRSGMYLAWLEDDIENEYVATHVMSNVNQYWIGEFSSVFFFFFCLLAYFKYCSSMANFAKIILAKYIPFRFLAQKYESVIICFV